MENRSYVMNKDIKLSELLVAIYDLIQDPNNKDKENKMIEMHKSILVRQYIPIKEKEMILLRIAGDITFDEDLDLVTGNIVTNLELSLLINGLLEYTNIINDLGTSGQIPGVYDYLYISGLLDYILSFCQADYEKLSNMAYRMIQIENAVQLYETLIGIDLDALDKTVQDLKNTVGSLDKDTMNQLLQVAEEYKINQEIKAEAELEAAIDM